MNEILSEYSWDVLKCEMENIEKYRKYRKRNIYLNIQCTYV